MMKKYEILLFIYPLKYFLDDEYSSRKDEELSDNILTSDDTMKVSI